MSIEATPPAPVPKTEATDAPIVSVLTGNRFCTGCGYNLIGQAVVREPVYDLLIARCPECGAAAAVTEYPTLGRWGRRLVAVLGGLWALFLVALLAPSVVSIFAFSLTFGEEASRDYRHHLSQLYEADNPKEAAAGTPVTRANFPTWWKVQDQAQIRRAAGSWLEVIDTRALFLWIPGVLITFIIGAIWSVVLIHRKRRWLPIVALIVLCFASVIATIQIADLQGRVSTSVYLVARQEIMPPMTWLGIAGFTVSMLLGMMLGRPIVRGLLRLLVAPRVCSNFSFLWTAEGLAPPRGDVIPPGR